MPAPGSRAQRGPRTSSGGHPVNDAGSCGYWIPAFAGMTTRGCGRVARQDTPSRSRAGIARAGSISPPANPCRCPDRGGGRSAEREPVSHKGRSAERPPRWSRTARPQRGSWTGGCLVAAPSAVLLPHRSHDTGPRTLCHATSGRWAAGRSSRRPLARYGGRPPLARQTPAPHPRSAIRTPHERAPG